MSGIFSSKNKTSNKKTMYRVFHVLCVYSVSCEQCIHACPVRAVCSSVSCVTCDPCHSMSTRNTMDRVVSSIMCYMCFQCFKCSSVSRADLCYSEVYVSMSTWNTWDRVLFLYLVSCVHVSLRDRPTEVQSGVLMF